MESKSNPIKNRKILTAIIGFSLPSWINALLSFLIIPVFTRLMLPEESGIFSMYATYSTLIYSIALIGLNQGLMRFYVEVPGRNTQSSYFRLILRILSVSLLLFCVLIVLFGNKLSFAISGSYNTKIVLCMIISVVFLSYSNIINSKYRMEQKLGSYCFLAILANACSTIAYVITIATNRSGVTAIYCLACFQMLSTLPFLIKELHSCKDQKIFCGKEELSPLLKFSLPLVLVMLMSQLNSSLPKLMMQKYLSYAGIGIYSAASSVASVITIIQAGINIYWPPFVYENYRENPELLSRAHELVTFVMVFFGMLLLVFQDIIFLLIGINYRSGQSIFGLLLISPILYMLAETTGLGINISKKSYLNIITYGTGAIVNLVICVLTIPRFGLYGAASSVAASAMAMYIMKTMLGEKYFQVIRNRRKSFAGPILFVVAVILNTVFANQCIIRCIISVIAMLLLIINHRSEIAIILQAVRNKVKSSRNSNGAG